ncbi:MAG: protein O-GlcNAcase [Deltaproteobacteria bacterium]|nr:protein O-GlcNAcase [Deltaproteobacteria bacterium]
MVEGFYGPVWDPAARYWFIDRLAPFGLDTYLFCPKHEPALAAEAMRPLHPAEIHRFSELAGFCRERNITPWAGVHFEPPFHPYDPDHLDRMAAKIHELVQAGFRGFAVLYDDLKSSLKNPDGSSATGGSLAQAQANAFVQVVRRCAALGVETQWVVCPSLYTLDPLLEKEYGAFEVGYLDNLHRGLPPEVPWFWTGPRVCSRTITLADKQAFLGDLPRKLILWDNYPVNDVGMVHHLHLGPLSGRGADLPQGVKGYLFNPMSQPSLGVIPGATCLMYASDPAGYNPEEAWKKSLRAFVPKPLWQPISVLEALTRRSALADEPRPSSRAGEAIREALRICWEEQKLPVEETLTMNMATLTAQLRQELSADMAAEAAPWLDRLDGARGIFAAKNKAARDEQIMVFRQSQPFVLGKWFNP